MGESKNRKSILMEVQRDAIEDLTMMSFILAILCNCSQ